MSRKLPLTPARLAANRANAQKSTGPSTPEGKAIASLNAMSHGLVSAQLLFRDDPVEVEAEFRSLLNGLTLALRPEGPFETLLVERIAVSHWRLARAARFEAQAAETSQDGLPDAADLQALVRYESLIDRQLHRALQNLLAMQAQRRAAGPAPDPRSVKIQNEATKTAFLPSPGPMDAQNP